MKLFVVTTSLFPLLRRTWKGNSYSPLICRFMYKCHACYWLHPYRKICSPGKNCVRYKLFQKHIFNNMQLYSKGVPWLRQFVSGLSMRRPGFAPRSVHVGCVVDKVALVRFISEFFGFPCQYNSTVALRTHVSSGGWTIDPLVTAVQRHSLTPSTWTTVQFYSNLSTFYQNLYLSICDGTESFLISIVKK
jgi:hypothetical protein